MASCIPAFEPFPTEPDEPVQSLLAKTLSTYWTLVQSICSVDDSRECQPPQSFAGCDSSGVAECLSGILIDSLREQWNRVQADDKEIAVLKRWLTTAFLNNGDCQKVADVHGAGLLMAAATVASIGNVRTCKSGREFVARPGLVPTQTGTCGRVRQIGLSPRGDTYLRTLLMHGTRPVIIHGTRSAWIDGLLKRRPFKCHSCRGRQQTGTNHLSGTCPPAGLSGFKRLP